MKKRVLAIFMLIVCMAGLAACGGKDDGTTSGNKTENAGSQEAQKDFDVSELADKLKNEGSFTDLQAMDSKIAVERLYNLDASKIEASAFYSNSNATAEDIAVVKVNDEAYADTVKKAFEDRIAEQKKSFQDYNAAEVPKLEDAVVKVSGKYAILVVSGDSAKAKEIVEGYVK